jgi:hypothetical protein
VLELPPPPLVPPVFTGQAVGVRQTPVGRCSMSLVLADMSQYWPWAQLASVRQPLMQVTPELEQCSPALHIGSQAVIPSTVDSLWPWAPQFDPSVPPPPLVAPPPLVPPPLVPPVLDAPEPLLSEFPQAAANVPTRRPRATKRILFMCSGSP